MSEKENIREIIVIGRGAESNFVANDGSVSRQHAQIVDYGTYYTVVDLGSTNGTFVNGRKVSSETTLHSGDELKVGNVVVPWEQLVQPPQKQKKAKVLLAILIPVIAVLLIGGALGAYFIWWHGKDVNNELARENTRRAEELSQQMTENKEKARRLEEEQNAKKALEQQKNDLDAAKKQAEKDKEEANKEAERAKRDADNAKKEAEKAKKEAEKAKKEAENAQAKADTKTKTIEKAAEEAKKKDEEKKKEIDTKKTQESQELKTQYEKLKTSINKLSEAKAKDVCYDLGMNLPMTAKYKNELLTEASKAYTNKDKERLENIEKAIKKNL